MEGAVVDVPLGGGKGIFVNPKKDKLSEGELERLTRGFAYKITKQLDLKRYSCT